MPYKLVRLIDSDEKDLILAGVPFPTGIDVEAETPEEKIAVKLLKFIDGSKTLGQLIEQLPLTQEQLAEAVCKLYDIGAIAFNQDYCDRYLVEDRLTDGEAEKTKKALPGEGIESSDKIHELHKGAGKPCQEKQTSVQELMGTESIAPSKEKEEKGEVEICEQGNIEEIPLWQRLNQLERKFFTGRVIIKTENTNQREIYFLNGNMQSAKSSLPKEDIGFLLFEKNKLSQNQYEAYKKEVKETCKNPYDILIDMGVIPAHQKIMAHRWASQVIVFNALTEKSGTFLIEKWDRLPKSIPRLGLNLKGIMGRFMKDVLPVEEEAEKLKEKMDWWIVALSNIEEGKNFSEKEKRLWEIIVEKPRRLRDIMVLTTMFKKDTYRFILSLLTSGLAELVKQPPIEEGPINLKELDEAYEILMESNYFDILMVHPINDTEEIKKAYEKVIKKFNLSLYKNLTEDQKNKLIEMKNKVEEAWSVLGDDNKRKTYRKKIFSDYQLRQYAQLQYQKAEIFLWWKQEYEKALEYFSSSMELDPQNPLYWASVAYCQSIAPSVDPHAHHTAMTLAEKVASASSVELSALVLAGGALINLGQKAQGEKLIEKAKAKAEDQAGINSLINLVLKRTKE